MHRISIVHVLCKAGNDVIVVSKGKWGEILAADGLRIHHRLQHKDTVDRPHIAKELPEGQFDAVFSVMQGCQQRIVLLSFCTRSKSAGKDEEYAQKRQRNREREVMRLCTYYSLY